jgi:hypothetical protein
VAPTGCDAFDIAALPVASQDNQLMSEHVAPVASSRLFDLNGEAD